MEERNTYGGYRNIKFSGIGAFSAVGTIFLIIVGIIFTLLICITSFSVVIVFTIIASIILIGFLRMPNSGGRVVYSSIGAKIQFRSKNQRVHKGINTLFKPHYLFKNSKVLTIKDNLDKEISLIQNKPSIVSIPLRCNSMGSSLLNINELNNYVVNWAKFLEHNTNVKMISITASTEMINNKEFKQSIKSKKSLEAEDTSIEIMNELLEKERTSSIDMYINLTYRISKRFNIASVLYKIPSIIQELNSTGAGYVTTLDEYEISKLYRRYVQKDFIGDKVPFSKSGVGTSIDNKDFYYHDGYYSYSFYLTEPPRGYIYAETLNRILSFSNDNISKSFTLFYKPLTSRQSMRAAESGRKNARANVTIFNKTTARSEIERETADKIAYEEALGGLLDFTAILTLTSNENNKEELHSIAEDLYMSANLNMKPIKYDQESAFYFNMPLGQIPWDHSKLGYELQKYI